MVLARIRLDRGTDVMDCSLERSLPAIQAASASRGLAACELRSEQQIERLEGALLVTHI